ncbi:MAG: DUF4394 domain-containing protein [Chitinophagaceae bacterium]
MKQRPFKWAAAIALVTNLAIGCKKNDAMPEPTTPKPDVVFYAVTDANQILKYNAQTTNMASATVNITGLPMGEKIISIDFRPSTGELYGLGSTSRLYTINYETGAALPLGTTTFTPALNSSVASIDFNPTVDRIRLVTNSGQNLRLHPELGTVAATDGAINGGMNPSITSIAYTNNFAGASTTDLFDIDVNSKKLYKQTPPNDGTLAEVGTINVNFTGKGGFDINADNSIILATLTVDSKSKLYMISTTDAKATYLADMSANNIIDIAIPTNPVAYAIDENNGFQIFNPMSNMAPINKTIAGLGVGESIVGIDFRPATHQLYGLATTSLGAARLYSFNVSTGAATAIGGGFMLNTTSTHFGFDFNPTVDRIRVVTNSGQNLRLNPNDGTLAATDGNLNPGSPMVSGAAYTNNFSGATTTVMYVTDMGKLYRQDPPNNGTLTEIGSLGINVEAVNGFDIGGKSNMAYALFTVSGSTKVYLINLNTGMATAGANFPNKVKAMALGLGF